MTDTLEDKDKDKLEPEQNQDKAPAQAVEEPKEDDVVEKNWKAVREKQKEKERLQKEQQEKIAQQEEMIAALERALKSNGTIPAQQATQTQSQGSGADIHDQEWITGAQFKEHLTKLEQQRKKEQQEYEAQKRQAETVQAMQARYPDYREVLSQENLAYLEYHEPEVAAGIQQIADPYYQMSMAYKSVKKFVPPLTPQDKAKIERTQNMPRSPSQTGLGVTPQGGEVRGNKLSKQQKEELYQQMLRDSR